MNNRKYYNYEYTWIYTHNVNFIRFHFYEILLEHFIMVRDIRGKILKFIYIYILKNT